MSVVHFTTEVSGGAGGVVINTHQAMLSMGIKSTIISRESAVINELKVVKPLTKSRQKLRALKTILSNYFNLIDPMYALFGTENSPVRLQDIERILYDCKPTTLVFYWTSYFIDLELILKLKHLYPEVKVVFVCMDEAFMTGGCHYSSGCEGYQVSCAYCPATRLPNLKLKIKRNLELKIGLLTLIKPIIIYPSGHLEKMGSVSSAFKRHKGHLIPLGAMYRQELIDIHRLVSKQSLLPSSNRIRLLVRSSSEPRKGCDLFLSALSIIKSKLPNIRELLEVFSIGDDYISQSNISEILDYQDLGIVDRKTLLSLYTKTDVLVVSSREDSGPLMINECVAVGVFVITTPIGVASDLIISNSIGTITKAVSPTAIAESLLRFVIDEKKTRALPSAEKTDFLTFEGFSSALVELTSSTGSSK